MSSSSPPTRTASGHRSPPTATLRFWRRPPPTTGRPSSTVTSSCGTDALPAASPRAAPIFECATGDLDEPTSAGAAPAQETPSGDMSLPFLSASAGLLGTVVLLHVQYGRWEIHERNHWALGFDPALESLSVCEPGRTGRPVGRSWTWRRGGPSTAEPAGRHSTPGSPLEPAPLPADVRPGASRLGLEPEGLGRFAGRRASRIPSCKRRI